MQIKRKEHRRDADATNQGRRRDAGATRHGLTLIEALLLLTIVSVVAVAAGVGLQAVAKVPAATDSIMAVNSLVVNVMEQTRANLIRNWPTTTWGGANYTFLANGVSYMPTAGTSLGGGYATPITGSSPAPITIDNKTYQVTLILATADPGMGSAAPDFMQVSVVVCPVNGGVVDAGSPQRMVTYVAQP
jgi:type II secretory pathway pseudopilin PulG